MASFFCVQHWAAPKNLCWIEVLYCTLIRYLIIYSALQCCVPHVALDSTAVVWESISFGTLVGYHWSAYIQLACATRRSSQNKSDQESALYFCVLCRTWNGWRGNDLEDLWQLLRPEDEIWAVWPNSTDFTNLWFWVKNLIQFICCFLFFVQVKLSVAFFPWHLVKSRRNLLKSQKSHNFFFDSRINWEIFDANVWHGHFFCFFVFFCLFGFFCLFVCLVFFCANLCKNNFCRLVTFGYFVQNVCLSWQCLVNLVCWAKRRQKSIIYYVFFALFVVPRRKLSQKISSSGIKVHS